MNRPKYAYLTLNDDRLELVVSDTRLEPAGARLLRNDSWPLSVNRLYNTSIQQTTETVKQALEEANQFLQGEIVTGGALEFGDKITKTRKRIT